MTKEKKKYDGFSFVEHETDSEYWNVKIKGGIYEDVVLRYGSVKLDTENEMINFDYDILDFKDENPHGIDEFNEIVGEILIDILQDAFDKGDYVIGEKDE